MKCAPQTPRIAQQQSPQTTCAACCSVSAGEVLRRLPSGVIVMVLMFCGCGPENRAAVSGTVTLDGAMLESGVINFFPTDGSRGPTAGGVIANGEYHISADKGVVPGKNRVTISSMQKTGRKIYGRDGDFNEERSEAIPAQYNAKSTLVYEILAGELELNFDLHGRVPIEESRRKYSAQ